MKNNRRWPLHLPILKVSTIFTHALVKQYNGSLIILFIVLIYANIKCINYFNSYARLQCEHYEYLARLKSLGNGIHKTN